MTLIALTTIKKLSVFRLIWSSQAESWATLEWARAVEKEAIGGVHLMLCGANITLYHPVHYGVKIAYPRKLERFVRTASGLNIIFENVGHNSTLDAFTLKLWCDAEDNTKDSVARTSHLQLPYQSQLLHQAEFAVEFTNYTIEVGHHNEEAYRLVVVVGKVDKFSIDNRSQCAHQRLCLLLAHRLHARKERPRLIVDCAQILCGLFEFYTP